MGAPLLQLKYLNKFSPSRGGWAPHISLEMCFGSLAVRGSGYQLGGLERWDGFSQESHLLIEDLKRKKKRKKRLAEFTNPDRPAWNSGRGPHLPCPGGFCLGALVGRLPEKIWEGGRSRYGVGVGSGVERPRYPQKQRKCFFLTRDMCWCNT